MSGLLYGAEDSGLVGSLIPLIAFESRERRVIFDAGAGGALLNRSRFALQDYGGTFQFALTAGASVSVYQRFAIEYRFVHYSDAAIHGPSTVGSDFHMLEYGYRF